MKAGRAGGALLEIFDRNWRLRTSATARALSFTESGRGGVLGVLGLVLGLGVGEELELGVGVRRQPVLLHRADGLRGRGGGITPSTFGVLKLPCDFGEDKLLVESAHKPLRVRDTDTFSWGSCIKI